jgi:malonate decarboxylase beta subunit
MPDHQAPKMFDQTILELSARERAKATFDPGTYREMLGPFDHVESPWLAPQGVVPQSDDGVVIALGRLSGEPTLAIAIEGRFQGGSIGEVSGAKICQALALALRANRSGDIIQVVLFLESGGVRLQEANLGLALIAKLQSVLIELRRYVPVTGVIAGPVGCFGGMAITAGLCSYLVMTREARLGLNGPEVIEQEAGVAEMDSSDRALIWSVFGGVSRFRSGLIDQLIENDVETLRSTLLKIFLAGPRRVHRSEEIDRFRAQIEVADSIPPGSMLESSNPRRGWVWFEALAGRRSNQTPPSLLRADADLGEDKARFLAVVPDPVARYPQARHGEVGLEEGWALAACLREVIAERSEPPRPIVAVVDVPSQAYGVEEETRGIFLACAAAVDAYAAARIAGHPIIALVVGKAFSGAFLAHGFQANQLLALNDSGVSIQAMGKESAARVTKRTVADLERLGREVLPMSYEIGACAQLGILHSLISVENAICPSPNDVHRVREALLNAIVAARSNGSELQSRFNSAAASSTRRGSLLVERTMAEQWPKVFARKG